MEPQVKYELFGNMIKEFAETEVKPLAHEVDEQERFPAETVEKMAEIGLMTWMFKVFLYVMLIVSDSFCDQVYR